MKNTLAGDQASRKIQDDPLLNYPENLIISRPDLKSRALLFSEGIVTVLFWGFWFYLWLPLISVVAWLLGFRLLYLHMIELGGFEGLVHQLHFFSSGLALFSGSLALWSFYNLKRYGSSTRRNTVLWTDMDKLAEDFSVTTQQVTDLQKAKKVSFFFDEQDKISTVEITDVV